MGLPNIAREKLKKNKSFKTVLVCYVSMSCGRIVCPVRLATVPGRSGKPTLAIDKSFQVWLLNPTNEPMQVSAGELFGFGTGSYSNTVVQRYWVYGDVFIIFPLEHLRKITLP